MKKVVLSFVLGLSITLVYSQAEIKFDRTDHDFGEVPENSYPKTTFKFYNKGNKPLQLTGVKASCGCTSPLWTDKEVQPGDSGKIDVTFNTNGYSNKEFAKSVIVTTNIMNGNQPYQEVLYIHGKVVVKEKIIPQYPLKLSDNQVDFGNIKYGKTASKTIVLSNNGDSVITIKELKLTCEKCIVAGASSMILSPQTSTTITLTYDGKSHEPRNFFEGLKIITNIPDKNAKELVEKGVFIKGEVLSKEAYTAWAKSLKVKASDKKAK